MGELRTQVGGTMTTSMNISGMPFYLHHNTNWLIVFLAPLHYWYLLGHLLV